MYVFSKCTVYPTTSPLFNKWYLLVDGKKIQNNLTGTTLNYMFFGPICHVPIKECDNPGDTNHSYRVVPPRFNGPVGQETFALLTNQLIL